MSASTGRPVAIAKLFFVMRMFLLYIVAPVLFLFICVFPSIPLLHTQRSVILTCGLPCIWAQEKALSFVIIRAW